MQAAGTSTLGFTGSAGTTNGATASNVLLLGNTILPNIDLVCHFTQGAIQDSVGVVGCYNSNGGTNYYRCTYAVAGGIATLRVTKVVLGGPTDIATFTVNQASAGFWIHFQITDLTGNELHASYWRDGETDPGWLLNATDSTQQLQVPGQCGIFVKANGTGSTQSFDSFTAQDVFAYAQPPTHPLDLPYGITVNVANGANATIPFLTQQAINDLLNLGGPGMWLRYQYQWASYEPNADGVYQTSVMDYAVSLCNSNGIRIVWPIQAPPTPYKTIRPSDGTTQAASSTNYGNAAAWLAVCTAVASRYNGTVNSPYTGYPMKLDAIQLENEDYDSNAHTPHDIQSQWLVLVAQACGPAIKAVHPTCKVLLCAVRKSAGTNNLAHIINWTTNLFVYNGGIQTSKIDALDFHYYLDGAAKGLDPTTFDANVPSVGMELAAIRNVVYSYGQSMGIWCNEAGWNWYNASSDVNVTDSQVSTSSAISQYNTAMADALRTGGSNGKYMIFTSDPTATVTTKNLQPGNVPTLVSSDQKSMTQTISGTYTYEPTWAVLQAYIAAHPTWAQFTPPVNSATIVSGTGIATIVSATEQGTIA